MISTWPVDPTAEDMHGFFDKVERLLEARPHAVVLNALGVETASIAVRNAAGRRLKVMAPLFQSRLLGQAMVLKSPLVRGALATVHFFAPPKYPARTFSELETAIAWAETRVEVAFARSLAR